MAQKQARAGARIERSAILARLRRDRTKAKSETVKAYIDHLRETYVLKRVLRVKKAKGGMW